MVFCNTVDGAIFKNIYLSHNPYFNRWFSAIKVIDYVKKQNRGHNPYFNRWFSAITTR